MNQTLAIVLQVFGYQLLLAMVTTIRIENVVVFDIPLSFRGIIGLCGIALVLTGAIGMRRSTHRECGNLQPNKSLNPTENKPAN
jgi:Na+-translocating ferredoxin:NAD+ oxidoreductase RnfA subunit